MRRDRFNQAFQALILSLLIHLAVTLGLYWAPLPENGEDTVSIEYIDPSQRQAGTRQTVVDETEKQKPPEPLIDRLKEQAQRLSEFNKRVEREQIARRQTGETQNARGNSNRNQFTPPIDFKSQARPLTPPTTKGEEPSRVNPLLNSSPQVRGAMNSSLALGESTSGNDIPGVQSGSFTALNTDQFTYYSFFERVNNAIRFRWISGVRRFAQSVSPTVINRLAKVPAPTLLRVLLDKEGMVVAVDVLASSGAKELDAAAVEAFYQASPLNHPPAGMIGEDRMVHLTYSFKVLFRPVYVAEGEAP
jgi:TonB family protein